MDAIKLLAVIRWNGLLNGRKEYAPAQEIIDSYLRGLNKVDQAKFWEDVTKMCLGKG